MNYRARFHDYREPAFYMLTLVSKNRQPRFSTCADDRVVFTTDGGIAHRFWHNIPKRFPEIKTGTLVVMPDHIHGILCVTQRMGKPLGVAVRAFKSLTTGELRRQHRVPALEVWEPGYHDHVLYSAGALRAWTRYLMDNPRRYCLKKANPDLFRRAEGLAHPALPSGQNWTGYGNRFLLDRPEKLAVRVSRKAAPGAIATLREKTLGAVAAGAVVVSPFISPGEKTIARAVLAAERGAVILMKPDGFPPFFKPKGRYFDVCAEGRLLILSASLPAEKPVALTREVCVAMNDWCGHIAGTGKRKGRVNRPRNRNTNQAGACGRQAARARARRTPACVPVMPPMFARAKKKEGRRIAPAFSL